MDCWRNAHLGGFELIEEQDSAMAENTDARADLVTRINDLLSGETPFNCEYHPNPSAWSG